MADFHPPVRPFAARAGTSIRSFKLVNRVSTSSPPSIGGNSTRRKAFGLPSLLGRRNQQPDPVLDVAILSKKLLSRTSEDQDPAYRPPPGSTSKRKDPPPPRARPLMAPPPQPQPRTTLLRKLTTKFTRSRPRSTSPPPARKRSFAVDTAARNAALRERGLLPALPLSVQEAQQDKQIAVVASPEPEPRSTLARQPTEAARIKDQWEAKNRTSKDDREADVKARLTEFRFGGNSPAASPLKESFPMSLEAVVEVETPQPSPDEKSIDEASMTPTKVPRAPPPTLNLSRGRNLSPPLLQAWSDFPPDPTQLPLPPSPSPVVESPFSSLISAFAPTPLVDAGFTPVSPEFLPLPPSPLLRDVPTRETSLPRMDGGYASESGESSLGVPSLMPDTASESASSNADNGAFGRMRSVNVRNSTIEIEPEHRAFQVIVETPAEEHEDPFSVIRTESPEPDAQIVALSTATPTLALVPPPKRRGTAPDEVAGGERRKSLLLSFRRSVGLGRANSTATRRKSAAGAPSSFDPSLLPPSPTLPVEFAQQQSRRSSINPTIHNGASIVFQTSKIEDDETRRMTEVAFM
ncbi:hypothetical protein MIND_00281300 [Mycena indigotica]|uniref:Uncharacterized protein n=1 Tax=Mycena indigotica TaxID=2126181 RepID=A0A8H6TB82_9AGAR|nr:uncharacterized protein MIND_00281300 [Mycena indigotica]KAF7312670.1 hypothetical protein MIND_00281300 [Mycena indigotica]